MRIMWMLKRVILWLLAVGSITACVQIVFPAANPLSTDQDEKTRAVLTPETIATGTPTQLNIRPRSWFTYAYFNWEHDGYPFQSEHFWIYSDSASMRTKERFAFEAELVLERILPEFQAAVEGAGEVDFLYPRMEVFISSRRYGEVLWMGYAHYGGFLIVYDGEYYNNYILQFPDHFPYTYVIAHELTHVFSARLVGNRGDDIYRSPQAWFDEGLATYFGIHPYPIRTVRQYEISKARVSNRSAEGNPINIRIIASLDYPENLYELAVYYLIEEYGLENVIGILLDMRSGLSFDQAFESRTGMTVNQYQEDFDSLVRAFLPAD